MCWDELKYELTYPWDNTAGYRGFGFDQTSDYFAKLTAKQYECYTDSESGVCYAE